MFKNKRFKGVFGDGVGINGQTCCSPVPLVVHGRVHVLYFASLTDLFFNYTQATSNTSEHIQIVNKF